MRCLLAACASAFLAWADAGLAAGYDAEDMEPVPLELRGCAERISPERTMVQKQRVKVVSDDGWVRESSRTMYWKRFEGDTIKVLFRVDEPTSEAGLKVLMIKSEDRDPEIYVYTPDTGRARRLVGSGASNSVLGTDFSFEDAMHLQSFLDAERTTRVDDADVAGHPVIVLETMTAPDTSAYSLIRAYVEERYCLPIKTEFLGPSGSLDKTFVAMRDHIEEIGGRWIPMQTVMFNHKYKSRTEFVVSDVEIDVELPDRLFTVAEVKKSN